MDNYLLIAIAAIGVLGSLAHWLSWWLKLPSILFLLLIGIILGEPVTGWLQPDVVFGDLLFTIV